MPLRSASLDQVIIDDEEPFLRIPLYAHLKDLLRRSGYHFRIPTGGRASASWDRVLFLNLTFWNGEEGGDVISDEHVPADVIAHAGWHQVVRQLLEPQVGPRPSADGLLLAEAVASGFDLYLVGRLLAEAPDSDFVTSQVPIMSEAAQQAGLADADFAALLLEISRDPERAFEDLRALLFEASTDLLRCPDTAAADGVLARLDGRRFAPLLHHYQLSNWILYARAYGAWEPERREEVRRADQALREAASPLAWLAERGLGQ